MPDCTEIEALLSDYLDRDLPPETCSAVEAHLASCARCGAVASALQRTIGICRKYRNENGPGPLAPDKHQEMIDALQRVLSDLQRGSA